MLNFNMLRPQRSVTVKPTVNRVNKQQKPGEESFCMLKKHCGLSLYATLTQCWAKSLNKKAAIKLSIAAVPPCVLL